MVIQALSFISLILRPYVQQPISTYGRKIHSGQYIKLRFGALYALYAGEDMGQGGASFELEHVFAHKKLALEYVSKKPMIALERR